MNSEILPYLLLAAQALILILLLLLWQRPRPEPLAPWFDALDEQIGRLERELRDELGRLRSSQHDQARMGREEQAQTLERLGQSLAARLTEQGGVQAAQLDTFARQLASQTQGLDARFEQLRAAVEARLGALQAENGGKLDEMRRTVDEKLHATLEVRLGESLRQLGAVQAAQLETFARQLALQTQGLDARFEQLRAAVEARLSALQQENTVKLDEMRRTVDEKLHATLEARLGESFRLVSERLEQVHRGLGEMQSLAAGVGDLKRVLTNVKTRGTWGEVQLQALLEQVLTPAQYAANVATAPGSAERVEYAIRLPGRGDDPDAVVWLPIDAKFPVEDYLKLIDAQERADLPAVETCGKALETRIRDEAKKIREKYIAPPHTTDFAILYLPIEGLYAEVLRRDGLAEALQRDCRVSLAGPTTLAAMMNSLQMGFRTLAIEQRSSEVWAVLGAVKTEFGKFGEALAHTRKKLQEASNSIDKAEVRTRAVTRKLRAVEALPGSEAEALIADYAAETGAETPDDSA